MHVELTQKSLMSNTIRPVLNTTRLKHPPIAPDSLQITILPVVVKINSEIGQSDPPSSLSLPGLSVEIESAQLPPVISSFSTSNCLLTVLKL